MAFQKNVFLLTGGGIPGQVFADSPHKVESFQLESASASYNVMGEACFTIVSQGVAQAGNPSGNGVFAGFLINPLVQTLATPGTGNVLAPSQLLQNGTQAELLTQGTIMVLLPDTANIGDYIIYNNATGAISSISPTASLPTGFSYAGAVVDYYSITVAGLAVITVVPGSGGLQSLNISNLIVGNLTASNFTQAYAPINMTGSGQIDFDGDSIMAGAVLPSPTTQRASALLCAHLGLTEHNFAVAGSEWQDTTSQTYANYIGGSPLMLAYGVNDLVFQNPQHYDNTRRIVECISLWACLSDTGRIHNAQDSSVTKTGAWSSSSINPIGVKNSSYAGTQSISFTSTGRYVVVGLSINNDTTNTTSSAFTLTVDSSVALTAVPLVNELSTSTILGNTFAAALLLFDTMGAANSTHTVTLAFTAIGGYTGIIGVDWCGGFDQGQAGTSPVIINAIQEFDMTDVEANPLYAYYCLNDMYRDVSIKFNYKLGLPIYFNLNPGNYGTLGMLYPNSGIVHPNPQGQHWLYENWLNMITRGAIETFIS